jgi:putative membrane protein
MKADFSKPQRQSIIGVLVLFLYTLQAYIRALWPIMVIWFFKFNDINKVYLTFGIFLFLVFTVVISYLKYLNFTFYIDQDNEEFIISEGVLNKTKTAIQLQKIQQVNINQSFIQRMIGVYELAVDTAGTNKKEAEICAISYQLALDLKACLLKNVLVNKDSPLKEGTVEFIEKKEDVYEIPFINISLKSLLKVGVTSNYVKNFFVLLAFFITLFDNVKQLTGKNILKDKNIDDFFDKSQIITVLLLVFTVLFLAIISVNLIKTIFIYFNYKILRHQGSLLISYGLFDTKSTILRPEKVQMTMVSQNYFQKKMDVLELKIKQASGGAKENQKSTIEILGCSNREKEAIFKLLFQKVIENGICLKPNFRKLAFSFFISIGIPLLGYVFLRNLGLTIIQDLDYFVLTYVFFVGTFQFFKFKNNKIYINTDFIILQSGVWDISREIIEPSKIQAITTSQLFWHKKINIGSLTLHTAGGNIVFQLGNFAVIKQYVNLWLYQIETSNSNWM